ncbi:MAG: PKD domain-containing protein, partial [Bacteroidota bacterium]
NFNDLSTVSSGSISSRSWNFGDGTSPNGSPTPSHLYLNAGTFTVSLIVTTNNSCKDTITKMVVVHPLPAAQFSSINVCDGSIVPFNDLSTIATTDTIQSWAWSFGDGSSVINNQNTTHLYASEGSYIVQLVVVSNFGCADSISKTKFVNPNPVVNFTANDTIGCEPLCVNFQNLSSIATGANVAWLWSFGDNSPINNLENPTYCYSNDSVRTTLFYTPTFTVTSDSGCVSSLSKNNYITVSPNPNANFTVEPKVASIVDPVISITDLSTGADFWSWNFGNQTASTIYNPAPQTYADTGTYIITLIISTQYNCIDTTTQSIIIEPDFIFYIPNAFTPNDDGINDAFTGKGIFITEFEMAIFDRWGNLIYKTDDINKPWDGKANEGKEAAQADVYVYAVKVTDFKMKKHTYKGIVTLVR